MIHFLAIALASVFVDDYADGSEWQHDAIKAAIVAAGDGGEVVFSGGSEYLICSNVYVDFDGQTWRSEGGPAVLKRCPEQSAELACDALAGSTSLCFVEPDPFGLGVDISPASGTLVNHPVIQGGSGDGFVTIYNGLASAASAGDIFITSFPMVTFRGDGATVKGLVFDGNARENDTYVAWQRHPTVTAYAGKGNSFTGCVFRDAQADHLMLTSQTSAKITGNAFIGGNGAGVHLSAVKNALIAKNSFVMTNQQPQRVGHAEAAVTWSNYNVGVAALDNSFYLVGTDALGLIAAHGGNSHAVISGNDSFGASGRSVSAFTVDDQQAHFVVYGNKADSGVYLRGSGADLSGVILDGNNFSAGYVDGVSGNLE